MAQYNDLWLVSHLPTLYLVVSITSILNYIQPSILALTLSVKHNLPSARFKQLHTTSINQRVLVNGMLKELCKVRVLWPYSNLPFVNLYSIIMRDTVKGKRRTRLN